jgi:hypothetical protein
MALPSEKLCVSPTLRSSNSTHSGSSNCPHSLQFCFAFIRSLVFPASIHSPLPPFPSHQLPRPHKQKAFKTHLHTLHTTPYRREVDHVELEWGRGTEGDHMLRQRQPQKLKRETKNHMCLCMRAYVAQYSKVNRCPACIYRIPRIEIGGMDTGYNGIVNFSTNNAIHSILLLEVFYSLVLPAGTSSPSLTSIFRSRHPGRV